MEVIDSGRGRLWVYENFIFKSNTTKNGVRYLTCNVQNCFSRASIREDTGVIKKVGTHNHPPDEVEVEIISFKGELRRLARLDRRPPREIFDDVSLRFPRAAVRIGFPQVRSAFYRHRNQGRPPIPNSLEEFVNILQTDQWKELSMVLEGDGQPFLRGLVGPPGQYGWQGAIFFSARCGDILGNTRRIHMDATFKVLPIQLNAYQLLTVHADHLNHLFPVAFVLMSRKTQIAYEGVLEYIANLLPQLQPEIVMTDYEAAMRNAARHVWPNARLVGCFFHYAQAVYRMHSSLRLQAYTEANMEAGKALRMLLALCLLPANRMATGLEVIRLYLRTHNLLDTFSILLMYMENYWFGTVGPDAVSVFGHSHRTNNALEGFYSRLLRRLGPHPAVWAFYEELRRVERSQWFDYIRLVDNVDHVRPIRMAYRRQDRNIRRASEQLQLGLYDEAQFLDRMSHCMEGFLASMGAHQLPAGEGRPAHPVMPPVPVNLIPPPVIPAALQPAPVDNPPPNQVVPAVASAPPPAAPGVLVRDPGTCVACLMNRATHVVIPCGHMCLCSDCAETLPQYQQSPNCPTCRQDAYGTYRVYLDV